ncbi:MAG: BNR repeat-containing protein [Candidatus Omnitrophota bacterium]
MNYRIYRLLYFIAAFGLLLHGRAAGWSEEIRRIPVAEGLASHPVNGGHCLISDGVYQYLAFYDGDHQMTIAKRKLGENQWEFAKLPERVGWDTHNTILMFLDREGQIHLTGNMHAASLKYYRTKIPGDIQTFQAIHTWTGKYEDRVTYPTLLKRHDGSIHLMYRHGGSGAGMRLLIHYSEKDHQWTGTGEGFISGLLTKPDCNAYPFGGIVEDASGTLHIAWCWRETPDVTTNFNVNYAQSLDGGYTWRKWNGEKLALPIQPENAEVVDLIAQKQGLMNGGSLAIDENGIPYIGYTRFDENGFNQMYAATPQGGVWKAVQLTDWKKQFWFEGRGTIPQYPPIPRISLSPDGTMNIRYANSTAEPNEGCMILTREKLLSLKPGECPIQPIADSSPIVPNIRAVNDGPLPPGQTHYMQQETDIPNRDRKPDNPRQPTMIYLAEVDKTK